MEWYHWLSIVCFPLFCYVCFKVGTFIPNGRPISWKNLEINEWYAVYKVSRNFWGTYVLVTDLAFGEPIFIVVPKEGTEDIESKDDIGIQRECGKLVFCVQKLKDSQRLKD